MLNIRQKKSSVANNKSPMISYAQHISNYQQPTTHDTNDIKNFLFLTFLSLLLAPDSVLFLFSPFVSFSLKKIHHIIQALDTLIGILLRQCTPHQEVVTDNRPEHRELHALLFTNSVWVLLHTELYTLKGCETELMVYPPCPRRLENLTRCYYKGSSFSSVI